MAGLYQVLSSFLQTARENLPAGTATGKTTESGVREATAAVNTERTQNPGSSPLTKNNSCENNTGSAKIITAICQERALQ